MPRCFLKTIITTSVAASMLMLSSAIAADVAPVKPKPVDADFLKILDSFANYNQTSDLEKVSKIDSTFYTSDPKTMADLQKRAKDAMDAYLKNNDNKQSGANQVLIDSLNDAYTVSNNKLQIQKAAAEAFDQASKEAIKLDKNEKAQEDKCVKGFSSALALGSSVSNDCNNQKNDDDKEACSNELSACSAKISSDSEKFNSYLKKREKLQASKVGYVEVGTDSDDLTANIPGSAQVCNRFSSAMASAEKSGDCLTKLANDEKNESYQNPPPKTPDLGINEDLDSHMLIPKHRALGWAIYKKMADDKVAETTEDMKKIKEYIEKLGGAVLDLNNGIELGEDDKNFITGGGFTIPVSVVKKFFATNPSPAEILKQAAALGVSAPELAHAMNIVGYGGAKPADSNSWAQTRELENKFLDKINQWTKDSGGSLDKSSRIQMPGVATVDTTKNVMSVKGLITPSIVKSFLDTQPTDQQFFSKMAELGLRQKDVGTLLNGQGLLFKDGDWRQALLNDNKYGSILNRLNNELYQGTTGYGVTNTYDVNALIVKGTGHIMDEENKSWVPYGFISGPGQQVYTDNQAPVPATFVTGGRFGTASNAIKSLKNVKVISPSELEKLRKK